MVSTGVRQRKLIASNINEKISDTVFQESVRQTREMLAVYGSGEPTVEYAEGLKGIAINVLGVAGYGVSRPWKGALEKQTPEPGFKLTYIEATRLAIDHIVEAHVFPAWFFHAEVHAAEGEGAGVCDPGVPGTYKEVCSIRRGRSRMER